MRYAKTLVSLFALASAFVLGAQTPQEQEAAQALKSGMHLRSFVNVQAGYEQDASAVPSILDLKSAEYVFGRLVSRQALAVQVTFNNSSQDHDLLVSQISLYFCEPPDGTQPPAVPTPPPNSAIPSSPLVRVTMLHCATPLSLASMDKIVLQGLADRGQSRDPRNMALRILEGLGAAAVPFPTFIHHIGASFTPAVAAWNGPGVDAYKMIFPDYTVNQVIRLSNMAFTTNKVVTKGTSETVMAFIPMDVILSKDDRHTFHSDPHKLFVDLASRAIVVVDANFITPVQPTTASVASVLFNLAAQRVEVKGAGFDTNSKVQVNGKAVPTAFWSAGSLWGMLDPAANLKNGDSVSIKVQQADGTITPDCPVTVGATEQACPAPPAAK